MSKTQTETYEYPGIPAEITKNQIDILTEYIEIKPWYIDDIKDALRAFKAASKRGENTNHRKRRIRLLHARLAGCHSKKQWETILDIFDYKCACCGCECIGGVPCKDHIVPIVYSGSDGVWNLQPLCRECNSSYDSDMDYRPDWLIDLLGQDLHGVYLELI